MKVQIVSDLHLEFRTKKIYDILVPSAPVLCMTGDICACGSADSFSKFINFLIYFSDKFDAIIHVAGNHEYYTAEHATPADIVNNTMTEIDKKLKQLNKQFKNYHYLNNSIFEYICKKTNKPYVFIGTTLWSYVPPDIEITDKMSNKSVRIDLRATIEKRMNDYNCIYVAVKNQQLRYPYRQYKVEDMLKKHKAAVIFLKKIICNAQNSKKTYMLLTHHKPIFDRDTDKRDEYTYAYENDLAHILLVPPIRAIAYGHTHIHYDKKINGVRVVSNPKGYVNQHTDYNDKFTINL